MPNDPFATRHGWTLYLYSAFRVPYDTLVTEVGKLAAFNPEGLATHPKAKLLKRINDLILEEIPSNPANPIFRQGSTLGTHHKDWFRAKFLGRFRMFYRYNTNAKLIIYCWVNDENTLRKSGAETDPYKLFAKMLKSGNPPNSWNDLWRTVVKGE